MEITQISDSDQICLYVTSITSDCYVNYWFSIENCLIVVPNICPQIFVFICTLEKQDYTHTYKDNDRREQAETRSSCAK